jgi:hypothetical protein
MDILSGILELLQHRKVGRGMTASRIRQVPIRLQEIG